MQTQMKCSIMVLWYFINVFTVWQRNRLSVGLPCLQNFVNVYMKFRKWNNSVYMQLPYWFFSLSRSFFLRTPTGSKKKKKTQFEAMCFTSCPLYIKMFYIYLIKMHEHCSYQGEIKFRTFSSQQTSVTVSAEHVRHSSNFINQLLLETLSNTSETEKKQQHYFS